MSQLKIILDQVVPAKQPWGARRRGGLPGKGIAGEVARLACVDALNCCAIEEPSSALSGTFATAISNISSLIKDALTPALRTLSRACRTGEGKTFWDYRFLPSIGRTKASLS